MPLIFEFSLGDDYFKVYYYYLPFACILAGIIWKTSHKGKAPSYQFILSIASLVMALLTIYVVANCIMEFLKVSDIWIYPNCSHLKY